MRSILVFLESIELKTIDRVFAEQTKTRSVVWKSFCFPQQAARHSILVAGSKRRPQRGSGGGGLFTIHIVDARGRCTACRCCTTSRFRA